VEQASEPLAAMYRRDSDRSLIVTRREQQNVTFSLVISFCVEVLNETAEGSLQSAFSKQDQL
jgi:hypothetical protein